MAHQFLSDSPLELASGQFSDVLPFTDSVPAEADQAYIRIIALFRDNEALGGEAPTIEIRAGEGSLTPLVVTPQGSDTTAVTMVGTNGVAAGTATCERENNDVYFIQISDIAKGNGPWQLRIKNNDPQTLHFVSISSTNAAETRQPWMIWGATRNSFTTSGNPDDLNFTLQALHSTHSVTVRNLGTRPLRFAETAGIPIGAPDSPAEIQRLPSSNDNNPQIDIHGVDDIVFGIHQNGADSTVTITHTMRADDPRHTANLTITVKRTNFPPPPPEAPCNIDHCAGYVPPPPYPPPHAVWTASGPCIQPGCGHGAEFHGLGPACQLGDSCPGFRDGTGRNWGTDDNASCVQPGCGHTWVPFHLSPPPEPRPCRTDDGCEDFVGSGPICRRGGCGHPDELHGEILM